MGLDIKDVIMSGSWRLAFGLIDSLIYSLLFLEYQLPWGATRGETTWLGAHMPNEILSLWIVSYLCCVGFLVRLYDVFTFILFDTANWE